MFKESSQNPKYGSKKKINFPGISFLKPTGRLKPCFKFAVFLSLFWLFGYFVFVYVSTFQSKLFKEFEKESINVKSLQQRVADLIARGFADDRVYDERLIDDEELIEQDDGITPEALKFMKRLRLKDPGENGLPVKLPQNISEKVKKLVKEGYDTHGYNGLWAKFT